MRSPVAMISGFAAVVSAEMGQFLTAWAFIIVALLLELAAAR